MCLTVSTREVLGYTRRMSYAQPVGFLGLGATASIPSAGLGKVRTKDGFEYQITPVDVLWAARAAEGEGHDAGDTLWTWTQRFALPNFRRRYRTLTELIQAHSQPTRSGAATGRSADREEATTPRTTAPRHVCAAATRSR